MNPLEKSHCPRFRWPVQIDLPDRQLQCRRGISPTISGITDIGTGRIGAQEWIVAAEKLADQASLGCRDAIRPCQGTNSEAITNAMANIDGLAGFEAVGEETLVGVSSIDGRRCRSGTSRASRPLTGSIMNLPK